MSSALSGRALEKRRRTLEAARGVILRSGLRGATMEAIAKAAGIAKPTLYAQFSDKNAIFEALIEDLVAAKTAVFLAAFDERGPLPERTGSALADMFGQIADMLEGSPHAAEIVSQPHKFAHKLDAVDDVVTDRLAVAFQAEGIDAPRETARVLLAAGTGILGKYSGGAAVRDAIALLCRKMLAR